MEGEKKRGVPYKPRADIIVRRRALRHFVVRPTSTLVLVAARRSQRIRHVPSLRNANGRPKRSQAVVVPADGHRVVSHRSCRSAAASLAPPPVDAAPNTASAAPHRKNAALRRLFSKIGVAVIGTKSSCIGWFVQTSTPSSGVRTATFSGCASTTYISSVSAMKKLYDAICGTDCSKSTASLALEHVSSTMRHKWPKHDARRRLSRRPTASAVNRYPHTRLIDPVISAAQQPRPHAGVAQRPFRLDRHEMTPRLEIEKVVIAGNDGPFGPSSHRRCCSSPVKFPPAPPCRRPLYRWSTDT